MKKPFKVYYFLAYEGHMEFEIFAYLKERFKNVFIKSNIKFTEKLNVIDENTGEEIVSMGKLNGVGDLRDFKNKYKKIKKDYKDEKILFFIDKDLKESGDIEKEITQGGDVVQFSVYNSEFVLLNLYGHNLLDISEFGSNLKDFRDYCKNEFRNVFGQNVKINYDLMKKIFGNISDEVIIQKFDVIFGLCDK